MTPDSHQPNQVLDRASVARWCAQQPDPLTYRLLDQIDKLTAEKAALGLWRDAVLDACALANLPITPADPRYLVFALTSYHSHGGIDNAVMERVAALVREVAHWKANHAKMVERTAVLAQRPDLPVERIDAYTRLATLQLENDSLRMIKQELVASCKELRAEASGAVKISDMLSELLRATAIALKGPEPKGEAHDWLDLPTIATRLCDNLDHAYANGLILMADARGRANRHDADGRDAPIEPGTAHYGRCDEA